MNTRAECRLLEMPIEVRDKIYGYLFAQGGPGLPILLDTPYKPLQLRILVNTLNTDDESEGEPRPPSAPSAYFYTAVFRVSRAISQDAIAYAYGANTFLLRTNFHAFCGLASNALRSIKTLEVHPGHMDNARLRAKAFDMLTSQCTNLRSLALELQSTWLLQTIPVLLKFLISVAVEQRRPTVLLDLYIWDHYVSYQNHSHAYRSAKDLLCGKSPGSWNTERVVEFRKVIPRLPRHAENITLVADIEMGELKAIEEFLEQGIPRPSSQEDHAMPRNGSRNSGRSRRRWIMWDSKLDD